MELRGNLAEFQQQNRILLRLLNLPESLELDVNLALKVG